MGSHRKPNGCNRVKQLNKARGNRSIERFFVDAAHWHNATAELQDIVPVRCAYDAAGVFTLSNERGKPEIPDYVQRYVDHELGLTEPRHASKAPHVQGIKASRRIPVQVAAS